jgi:hypothetical protein
MPCLASRAPTCAEKLATALRGSICAARSANPPVALAANVLGSSCVARLVS